MTESPDTTESRCIVVDAAGPARLVFTKRDGYAIEIDGRRVRVQHLRDITTAYDQATKGN